MKRKGTFLVGLAAGLTVAALLPTVATGAESPMALNDRAHHGVAADLARPDDRATHGVGSIGLVASPSAVRPDDRANPRPTVGNLPSTTAPSSTRPDDRPGNRGPGAFDTGSPTTTTVTSSPNTFDWGDASIGLLGGFGVALLIGGIAILTTRRTGARVAHS